MFYVGISSVSRRCASRDSTNHNASFVDRFSRLERAAFRGTCGEMFALFQTCVGNSTLYRRGKLLELFILIALALLLNILLSWAFVTNLNCSVKCKPPWWFDRKFRCSSWIHSWLLVAVLSDYFGQLVTSNFLLCKFRGLPWSSPDCFPVMRRWKCLGMKRLSQQVAQVPRNGLRNLLPTWSE